QCRKCRPAIRLLPGWQPGKIEGAWPEGLSGATHLLPNVPLSGRELLEVSPVKAAGLGRLLPAAPAEAAVTPHLSLRQGSYTARLRTGKSRSSEQGTDEPPGGVGPRRDCHSGRQHDPARLRWLPGGRGGAFLQVGLSGRQGRNRGRSGGPIRQNKGAVSVEPQEAAENHRLHPARHLDPTPGVEGT